jgi:hypothetical protein
MPTTDEVPSINPGDAITATYLSRMAMEINLLRREVDTLKAALEQERFAEVVPLEITGLETEETPGVYTASTITAGVPELDETEPDIDTLGAKTEDDAIVWDLSAIDGAVMGRYLGIRSSDKKMVFVVESGSIEVTLSSDGGSDGTVSTAPTYTYTATDLNGNTIATGLSPSHNRPIGKTMAGTRGRIRVIAGTPTLISTDERPNFAECS